jgi:hypothetical protein
MVKVCCSRPLFVEALRLDFERAGASVMSVSICPSAIVETCDLYLPSQLYFKFLENKPRAKAVPKHAQTKLSAAPTF